MQEFLLCPTCVIWSEWLMGPVLFWRKTSPGATEQEWRHGAKCPGWAYGMLQRWMEGPEVEKEQLKELIVHRIGRQT